MFSEDACFYSLVIEKADDKGYSCSMIKAGSAFFPGAIIKIVSDTPEMSMGKIEEYLMTGKFQNQPKTNFKSKEGDIQQVSEFEGV